MTKRSLSRLLLIISAALAATLTPSRALAQAKASVQPESFEKPKLPPAKPTPTTKPTPAPTPTPERERAATKIDEFGRLYACDAGARLDNFAIELEKSNDSVGYIFARDARDSGPFKAHLWGEELRDYLVNVRGIVESRVRLLDADRVAGEELRMELWVVPEDAEPPAVPPLSEKKAARPFAGKFNEYYAYDGTVFYDVDGGESGSYSIGIDHAAFLETLKRQPDSQGYIVVYARPDKYPTYWRNVATREQQKLAGDGIGVERLTVIRGGVYKSRRKGVRSEDEDDTMETDRIELWIGEKGKPPVKHKPEKAILREAARVASLDGYSSDDEQINIWALDNLFEALRATQNGTACIVIFPSGDSDDGLTVDSEGHEKKRPSVFQVAETLKAELLRRGIAENRVVLMQGPAEDFGTIELWAVPYGAAMPDPFAKVDTGTEESEESPAPLN